jgi:hypothetical protein
MAEVGIEAAANAYRTAASEMDLAGGQLTSKQRDPAVEHQKLAEKALRAGIQALQDALAAIAQAETPPTNIEATGSLDPLQSLLLLAMEEQDLRDATLAGRDADLPDLAPKQDQIHKDAGNLADIPTISDAADSIHGAMTEMEGASSELKKPGRQAAAEHERLAEKNLRMGFARIVISLYGTPPDAPATPEETGVMDPNAIPPMNSMEHWSTFVKGTPGGADVNRDKMQWESLTERDRAALNENFARELPLEYRQLLKDYYEALAK